MELFGVGLPELMVIAIVALVILGPDRLPEAARTIGKGIAEFRRATEPARTMWRDISSEITNVATTTQSAMQPVLKPGSLLDLNKGNNAVRSDGNGAAAPLPAVTEMMTPQERDSFLAGGQLPQHVTGQIAEQVNSGSTGYGIGANGHSTANLRDAVELPHLDYAMPHSEISYEPAPPYNEDLWYPAPFDTEASTGDQNQPGTDAGESY